jgi:hypothetical protein
MTGVEHQIDLLVQNAENNDGEAYREHCTFLWEGWP